MPVRQMSSGNNAFVSAIAPTTPGAAARILQHSKASKLTTNQVRNRPFLKFPMQTTARTSFSSPQINGRNDAFASTLTPAQPCRLTALRILRTSHHGQSTKSLTSQINHLCHVILLSLHQQGSSYWSRLESLTILLVRIGPVLHATTGTPCRLVLAFLQAHELCLLLALVLVGKGLLG